MDGWLRDESRAKWMDKCLIDGWMNEWIDSC